MAEAEAILGGMRARRLQEGEQEHGKKVIQHGRAG